MENRLATYNFSPGPGCLPTEVLLRTQRELLDFEGSGMSIMEHSHRDDGAVHKVMTEATQALRELLAIPENYEVLFFQSGAHAQFSAVPLNLTQSENDTVDYIVTGIWSQKAADEAKKFCKVNVHNCVDENYTRLTHIEDWKKLLSPDSKYVYLCPNETMVGLEVFEDPDVPDKIVVGDFTSTLLSRKVNVARYGVIFASGGKNLGPSGCCIVIVRKDLVRDPRAICPGVLSWFANSHSSPIPSLYQTPPTFNIYMFWQQWKYILEEGGVEKFEARAIERANRIYSVIDNSNGFYTNEVDPQYRSRMSIIFRIANHDLEKVFVSESVEKRFYQLNGHPLWPRLRIILYYGVPDYAVDAVVKFMQEFQVRHQHEL